MNVVKNFGLSYDICDATLMYAFVLEGNIHFQVYGDGNIIIKQSNEKYVWSNLYYESNAPFYLSYEMDVLRKHGYVEDPEFGGKSFTIKDTAYNSKNDTSCGLTSLKLIKHYGNVLKADNIESITLTSDGAETYSHTHKRLTEYPSNEEKMSLRPEAMIKRMTDYKNYNGEFVKRRMKRIKGECEKMQAEHFDDVSCATIWIDHGKES